MGFFLFDQLTKESSGAGSVIDEHWKRKASHHLCHRFGIFVMKNSTAHSTFQPATDGKFLSHESDKNQSAAFARIWWAFWLTVDFFYRAVVAVAAAALLPSWRAKVTWGQMGVQVKHLVRD